MLCRQSRYKPFRNFACLSRGPMEDNHLSPDVIWKFAAGITIPTADELVHVQNCDQCSNACWKLNRDARRVSLDEAAMKKSA